MEFAKTGIAIAIAALAALIAYATRPSQNDFTSLPESKVINTVLFKGFDDPVKAASLEIVKPDATTGGVERFKLVRDTGTRNAGPFLPMRIIRPMPKNEIRDVSVMFVDLTILGVAAKVPERHPHFGVAEPTDAEGSSEGVGTLVRIEGDDGEELVSLIIGKKDRDDETQRFVRIPGQDWVYVVRIDPHTVDDRLRVLDRERPVAGQCV